MYPDPISTPLNPFHRATGPLTDAGIVIGNGGAKRSGIRIFCWSRCQPRCTRKPGKRSPFHGHSRHLTVEVGRCPPVKAICRLQTGSLLRLVRTRQTACPELAPDSGRYESAEVSCGLPEAIDAAEVLGQTG